MSEVPTVSLYIVLLPFSSDYLAGFDSISKQSTTTKDPLLAKKFSNKRDIKLRPGEALVELTVQLDNVTISAPFRPHRHIIKKED